jgi:hypothetical protein
MAHIFKYPKDGKKGIIVFTHKEMIEYVYKWFITSRRDYLFNLFKIYNLPFKIIKQFLINQKIEKLRKHYFIGIHYGWILINPKIPEWVDFHMAKKTTLILNDYSDKFLIPLASRNFTPMVMKHKAIDKYWDIVIVAKNIKHKQLDVFLKEVRKIYDLGYKYKILIISSSNKGEESNKSYANNLFDIYFNDFSYEERENITLLKLDWRLGFQGLHYSTVSHLLNQSKVFAFFTKEEGVAKALQEALLCGLPVVAYKNLKGGGADYLNSDNSILFEKFENAHKSLIEAVENYDKFTLHTETLEKELYDKYSLERFKKYMNILYEKNGQKFDGELVNTDNLNRRLPAHFYDKNLGWCDDEKYRYTTTDVVSLYEFNRFYKKCMENI